MSSSVAETLVVGNTVVQNPAVFCLSGSAALKPRLARGVTHTRERNYSQKRRARPIADAIDDDALAAVTDAGVLGLVFIEIPPMVARDPQIGRLLAPLSHRGEWQPC